MTEYNQGGWLPPATTIAVTIDPDECILFRQPGTTDEWACRRAEHVDRQCRDGQYPRTTSV